MYPYFYKFRYLWIFFLLFIPVFGYLDIMPIRIWDEARVAMNSYEMLNDGDYIVTHLDGAPEMWNTKPPLLNWIQVICMKLFGVNEVSIRLPSAIAALLTILLLLIFAERYMRNFWFGFIIIAVLLTSHGYINLHATRTGDYDALLTFFTTLSSLSLFLYVENKRSKYLYVFFIGLALGVLTKSITGLLFAPGLLVYLLWQKQFIPLFKTKHFYFGIGVFILLVFGFYLLREFKNPGYLVAVWENEIGGRYLETIEKHNASFWFYHNNFLNFQIPFWYLFLPFGLIIGISNKNEKFRKIAAFSFLLLLNFFLIISSSKTKLEWYDVPMYPFIAIIVAFVIHYVFDLLKNNSILKESLKYPVLPYLFLFLVFYNPYKKIINKTYLPKEYPWEVDFYEIGYYLKDAIRGKHTVKNCVLLYDGYNYHNKFYLNILNKKGNNIDFKHFSVLADGDSAIVVQGDIKNQIKSNYVFKTLETVGNVEKIQILHKIKWE